MIRHQWKLSALKLMSFAPITALGLLVLPTHAQAAPKPASVTPENSGFTQVQQGRLTILMPTPLRRTCQSRCNTCQSRCRVCQSR
jgi:hypothetical protein